MHTAAIALIVASCIANVVCVIVIIKLRRQIEYMRELIRDYED